MAKLNSAKITPIMANLPMRFLVLVAIGIL